MDRPVLLCTLSALPAPPGPGNFVPARNTRKRERALEVAQLPGLNACRPLLRGRASSMFNIIPARPDVKMALVRGENRVFGKVNANGLDCPLNARTLGRQRE